MVAADTTLPNAPVVFGTLLLDELKNSRRHVVKNSADREEVQFRLQQQLQYHAFVISVNLEISWDTL